MEVGGKEGLTKVGLGNARRKPCPLPPFPFNAVQPTTPHYTEVRNANVRTFVSRLSTLEGTEEYKVAVDTLRPTREHAHVPVSVPSQARLRRSPVSKRTSHRPNTVLTHKKKATRKASARKDKGGKGGRGRTHDECACHSSI